MKPVRGEVKSSQSTQLGQGSDESTLRGLATSSITPTLKRLRNEDGIQQGDLNLDERKVSTDHESKCEGGLYRLLDQQQKEML